MLYPTEPLQDECVQLRECVNIFINTYSLNRHYSSALNFTQYIFCDISQLCKTLWHDIIFILLKKGP